LFFLSLLCNFVPQLESVFYNYNYNAKENALCFSRMQMQRDVRRTQFSGLGDRRGSDTW